MNILSAIPEQKFTKTEKLEWIAKQCSKFNLDILITPQEYFGGVQKFLFNTDEPLVYLEKDLLPELTDIADKYETGLIVGALIRDKKLFENRERVYIIQPHEGVIGFVDKSFLPAYDIVNSGKMEITPELDMKNRSKVFNLMGTKVSVLFCWEVFSNYIWNSLCRAQPDFVANLVKFGVKAWPIKGKEGLHKTVEGFGFGGDGFWMNRLQMGCTYDVACPVISSTNTWELPPRAGPICGVMLPWEHPKDKLESSLWTPPPRSPEILERISVDEFDHLYWRNVREHKTQMFKDTGRWPDAIAHTFTMMWKIKRMEKKATPEEYEHGVEELSS